MGISLTDRICICAGARKPAAGCGHDAAYSGKAAAGHYHCGAAAPFHALLRRPEEITRLPQRTAIVAFSADEVYAIAELIAASAAVAAVVLGALSPRTRNAQVGLYQSGDVEYLVATDAIGMGLNLDVDHVAFAQDRKFRWLSVPQP